MAHLIDKDVIITEIEKQRQLVFPQNTGEMKVADVPKPLKQGWLNALSWMKKTIDTLKVKDPYEQYVQYDSIKTGIQAHAETYSFNIESQLFPQLTKEQQALWRKEIEQAVISGGEMGVELAKDARYKENLKVKEVDLNEYINKYFKEWYVDLTEQGNILHTPDGNAGLMSVKEVAKHFFELGIQVSNKTQKGEEV